MELPRPRKETEKPPKAPTNWESSPPDNKSVRDLGAPACRPIPGIRRCRQGPDKATWLLAHLLDWHRREDKASWWRFFELMTLSDDELFEEQEPIAKLKPQGVVEVKPSGKKVYRYTFPAQEHKVGSRSELYDPRLPPFEEGDLGRGVIDKDALTLDITRPAEWNGPHPTSVVPHDRIPIEGLQDALERFGLWVADHGVADHGVASDDEEYRAVRDLLLSMPPRLQGPVSGNESLKRDGEPGSDAAQRLALNLNGTTLAIQGPPGSGKTYSGARMILKLLRDPGRGGASASREAATRSSRTCSTRYGTRLRRKG